MASTKLGAIDLPITDAQGKKIRSISDREIYEKQ